MVDKERSLIYRRAEWFGNIPPQASFEWCLREALHKLPYIVDNRITREDGVTAEVRHYDVQQNGVYLHVAAYTPHEDMSVVPMADRVPQADLNATPAPEGTEFMDGDLMLKVTGNNVVLCPSGLREGFVGQYFRLLFQQAQMENWTEDFDLLKIANVDKVEQIEREGVKAIRLDVGLYEEGVEEIRRTMRRSLNDELRDWLLSMFMDDPDLQQLRQEENLNARLLITWDGRRGGGQIGLRRLAEMSTQLVGEEEEGYTVETRSGATIRAQELNLRKKVVLQAFGKTVNHQNAWREIKRYFDELEENGALGY